MSCAFRTMPPLREAEEAQEESGEEDSDEEAEGQEDDEVLRCLKDEERADEWRVVQYSCSFLLILDS